MNKRAIRPPSMTPKNEIYSFKNNIFEKSFVIFILIDIFMGGGQPLTKTLKGYGDGATTPPGVPISGHNRKCS
jgi:hypothetical protein